MRSAPESGSRARADPRDLRGIERSLMIAEPGSKLHPIGMDSVSIGTDALQSLPQAVERHLRSGPIALLSDSEPMHRGPADLKAAVEEQLAALGSVVPVRLGQQGTELHADAGAIDEAVRAGHGAGLIVAVGSGTICDIGKEASRLLGVPYVIVQTANSVNAFSDDMAVLLVRGVKRTLPSRWPDSLIVDLGVLADAPEALNRAGVGELAAMWTAPADWRLAAATGADVSWDRRVVDLFRDGADALLVAAPGATSDLRSLEVMAELMTLSGLALGIAGRTAPISGTEHAISHMLDISAEADGRRTGLHGAQVGVGAVIAAVIWDRVLGSLDPAALRSEQLRDGRDVAAEIAAAFLPLDDSGEAAAECSEHYRAKLEAWAANAATRAASAGDWPRIATELRGLLAPPQTVVRLLRSAGAPATFEELDGGVSRERAIWAVLNSPLQRGRFSVADLAQAAGMWNREFVVDAIDEAARIAGWAWTDTPAHSGEAGA